MRQPALTTTASFQALKSHAAEAKNWQLRQLFAADAQRFPKLTVDAAGLCLKSGNAALLRGSSSASSTNAALVDAMKTIQRIMGDDSEVVVAKGGRAKIEYTTTNQPLLAKKFDVIGGKTGS